MARFLLIHGAWHGGWCWEKVADRLRAAGHQVLAPDLAGLGADCSNRSTGLARQSVELLVRLIDASSEPVTLVAHSLGGMFAAEVSERRADRIRRVVYVAAFLPRDGQCSTMFGSLDSGSVPYGMKVIPEEGLAYFREDWLRLTFFGDCTEADFAWAKARVTPQPLDHFGFTVSLTEARFGTVPRSYVECLRDHAITPGFQRAMRHISPCERVHVMDTGHSPFISAPDGLASILTFEAGCD